MLRPGDHIWAGVGQSPLLVAHEREDLPSRALRPLRLPNQDFVLHYQGKYYTTAVKTLESRPPHAAASESARPGS